MPSRGLAHASAFAGPTTSEQRRLRVRHPFIAARRARDAYLADHEGRAPSTWDEIKDLVENYLKPVLFADLSNVSTSRGLEDIDLREAAERLRADRGTALKQLRRFFDRFKEAT